MNDQTTGAGAAKRGRPPGAAKQAGSTQTTTSSGNSHRKRQPVRIASSIASLQRTVNQMGDRLDERLQRIERRVS